MQAKKKSSADAKHVAAVRFGRVVNKLTARLTMN